MGANWPTSIKVKVGDNDTEVPVTYLDKDVIEEGDYVHPITNQKFKVDGARIDHWAQQFGAMQQAGLEVPTPIDHKPNEFARGKKGFVSGTDNIGFVVGARKVQGADGKARLRLTHQVIGEDAVAKAMRNRVSIKVDPIFKDERGRVWKDVIVHSAYTPIPVVSGMGSFAAFAAARQGEGVEEYQPARDMEHVMAENNGSGVLTPERRNQIGQLMLEGGEADIQAIADMSDEDMLKWFLDYAFSEANDEDDGVTDMDQLEAPLAASRQQQGGDDDDNRITPAEQQLMLSMARTVEQRIDLHTQKGELTPAQATQLKGRLMDGQQPNVLQLSMDPRDRKCQIERDLDLIVAGAQSRSNNGRTANQAVAMARAVPGGDAGGQSEVDKAIEEDKKWAASQNKRK